ncbi:MAG: hypothetical protein J6T97_00275 [Bacteroidaceae bacterium]|nr:hypothetical protein [Bacteroidaceae bacterium]
MRKLTTTLLVLLFTALNAPATDITSLSQINDANGNYTITDNIDATDYSSIATFTGTLTAAINPATNSPYIISNLSCPLFTTATGATISNIMLKDVSISQDGYVGAICGTANGATRIYNCGILPSANDASTTSSIGSTNNYCGSLVGFLDGTARVINCFSYANITSGTVRAGIVGYNNYASKYGKTNNVSNIRTMVMNCMFYGDINYSSGSVYPIYGGLTIQNEDNFRLNNYNYFLYDADFSAGQHVTDYNRALAAEERFLVRFEFYRYLLNSTRELASWYVYGSVQSDAHTKMLKWVLDKNIAPYPILKQQGTYPSVVNYDPENTFDSETGTSVARTSVTERNKGKNLGTLTVNISLGSGYPSGASIRDGKSQITLQRTDKDYDDYNFNYDKVQLPYYNEVGTGNCTGNKVVTGWKITGVTGGTAGTFTASDTWDGYDFADRSHYAKDLYSQSGRVFSQGAYFDVPDGVTSIDIEPYWGTAAYLADANYDCYGYKTSQGVGDFGTHYTNNQTYNICGDDQKVYTGFSSALESLSGSTVYDNVIVLVGNWHQQNSPTTSKAITIMSADLDNDNEPDYSFIFNSGKGLEICPIRFDFVNVPGTAMAHKNTSGTYMGIMGNHKWNGWLEVTNTSFIRFSQLEYDSEKKNGSHPLILLGGVVEQMVSTNGNEGSVKNTKYIHVGSNVWFKLFNNGCHIDKTKTPTPRIPISVTGGDFEKFYLSGYLQPNAPTNANDHAECYISGGRFGEVAGAGQEQINGNVQWLIDRADITSFYGGGINDKKPITGNITVTIRNSHVGTYCGGPKFGNMASDKTVSTTATDCTFGTYFGAGYGGTSLFRFTPTDQSHNKFNELNYPWNDWLSDSKGFSRGGYDSAKGIAVSYEYEHFEGSNDKTVGRLYVNYASLSVAQTNNVTSSLTGCAITGNFYGGGSLGKVNGNATSTLLNCTVSGSVFGAGYSASVPTASVYPGNFVTEPHYNSTTGVFEKGVFPEAVEYTWSNDKGSNSSTLTDEGDNHFIFVSQDVVNLNELGTVSGKVTLNLEGNTSVAGNVFGGGDESNLTGDADVNISGTATVSQKVFGGGNKANYGGKDTKVTLTSGSVAGGVYGGCNINGIITGNTTVYLNGGIVGAAGNNDDHIVFGGGYGANTSTNGNVTLTINGSTIHGNVYGGSAMGNVNASNKTTTVTLTTGTINGSLYGGGLGDADHAALVNGNVQVIVDGGTISGDVYGCNNVNGAPQGTVMVDINATDPAQSGYAISKVFGGGNQAAYTGSPVVRIHGCDNTIEYVYGGGNQASVRGTGVTVYGGSIGYVFGGGYGADVTHDGTDVNIYGGNIGYVFGGNDHSGTVHGDIDVDIQEQAEPNHQLCALTIGEVYGGGQLADAAGGVTVNVRKSVITGDVYGGGAKANTNTGNIIDQQTIDTDLNVTEVNLYPNATINGDVYGGGRGYKDANPENDIEATVYGDVTVYQLGAVLVPEITDGIAQSGRIFGCNNINGTPKGHVLVYVSKTVKNSESDTYAISAVYGGGNMAEYVPFRIGQDDSDCTEVRIDGCDDVTIHSVYGGGNAASTPATQVFISGAKEIMYVFGGGNGAGNNNPGANVGYHYYDVDGPLGGTTDEDIANRLDPQNHLVYGSGVASTTIYGGHIHYVYGGSNTKGNIREASVSMLDELSDCELQIDGIYGGGRAAYMEGRTSVELGCLTGMEAIYGGSENADVGSDVELTISSGHFDKVFGGNNKGGRIFGSITVNIEQTGCLPITIDELYLGGDNAPYSVYGYKDSTYTVNINGENITHYGLKESGSKYNDPLLNLRSFVSIGTVYGGGNGIHATMVGNPKVDINITHGWINGEYNGTIQSLSQYKGRPQQLANDGVIGTVYGGGNSAKVIGSTNVFIGDKLNDQVELKSMRTLYNSLGNSDKVKETVTISKTTVNSADAVKYTSNSDANVTITQTVSQTVNGATITGNVYGGGNNADVTESANIQVGPAIY